MMMLQLIFVIIYGVHTPTLLIKYFGFSWIAKNLKELRKDDKTFTEQSLSAVCSDGDEKDF